MGRNLIAVTSLSHPGFINVLGGYYLRYAKVTILRCAVMNE